MPDVVITFKLPETPGLRDIGGRFTSEGRRIQADHNRRLAAVVQADVVLRMRNHIAFGRRASASTGRLVSATADAGNARILNGGFGFAVGIPAYLDKSVAKYWRTFEEGSAGLWKKPFIGTQLVQFRKNPGRLPSAHGTDLRTARTGGNFAGYRGAESMYVVGREIAPAFIYRDVATNANLAEEGYRAAFNVLQAVFRRQIQPGGGYFSQ